MNAHALFVHFCQFLTITSAISSPHDLLSLIIYYIHSKVIFKVRQIVKTIIQPICHLYYMIVYERSIQNVDGSGEAGIGEYYLG